MTFHNVPKISRCLFISIRKYCKDNSDKNSESIWNFFKGGRRKKEAPPIEAHTKPRERKQELSQFGGTAYRTCGSAYVVQKNVIPTKNSQKSKEDQILERIEADLSLKNNVEDPMPPFQSVEQRLIDLNERRLHPFYKKYLSMAKAINPNENENKLELRQQYKCKTGPIQPEEIPAHLKLSKEFLEKKNIFADFKGVELPRQMLVKIIEIDKNKRPTLEKSNKKEIKSDK